MSDTLLNPYFGEFGGMYVPEILVPVLKQLEQAFVEAQNDPTFQAEFADLLKNYAGRPTALTLCRNLTKGTKTKLYLKREDLLHGGAHKTNQVLGQILLAKRMGKTRIIAETGAGQHGVATALACAMLDMPCRVYMGAKDVERQSPNVFRMRLMGAEVVPAQKGSCSLKDACCEAMRDWSANYETTHYLLGTAAGPHPFPTIVREFQKMIGIETKRQILEREGRLPDAVIAAVGGGSNAIGMFADFIEETAVKLIGVEPAGKGIETGEHGAPLKHGTTGIYFGMKSPIMQDKDGQIEESYSISAGLDFPSVGPQHAYLNAIGRADYVSITDEEALNAFQELAKRMGKTRIIAETGAGQHGVATALACAMLDMPCRVYMGAKDVERQSPNVFRMRLMGAEVIPVQKGSCSLKDACCEAMRDWSANYENTHYLLGTAAGPHPFPTIVREFQKMIGEETKRQILEKEGRLPDAVIAAVGGGSNAIGMFTDFIDEKGVRLIGVEPAGHGIESGEHGAPLGHAKVGIYFGMKSPLMQTEDGQVEESYSISAGLDFPSVGPQHAYLQSIGRAEYPSITDDEALNAFQELAKHEGIIPALESSHALAHALKMIHQEPNKEQILVVNLSGRGDKDIFTVDKVLKEKGMQ